MSDNQEIKDALKQALKEWLEEKYASFGRFTFYGAIALLFTAVMYLAVSFGWRPDI